MADDDDDNIVLLRPEVKQPPVTVRGYRHDSCKHPRIDLDRGERTATCHRCEAAVDPFDWLLDHAGDTWTRIWDEYQHLKEEVGRLRREEKDLKRRVQNLKSQHKRWSRKQLTTEAVADVAIGDPEGRASSLRP